MGGDGERSWEGVLREVARQLCGVGIGREQGGERAGRCGERLDAYNGSYVDVPTWIWEGLHCDYQQFCKKVKYML